MTGTPLGKGNLELEGIGEPVESCFDDPGGDYMSSKNCLQNGACRVQRSRFLQAGFRAVILVCHIYLLSLRFPALFASCYECWWLSVLA